jgi:PAS domain S-box-containing protein
MFRSKFLREWNQKPPTLLAPQYLLVFVLVVLIYFSAGKLGLALAVVHPSATAVWPPSGIALAVLLLLGMRLWPAIFLGAFLINLNTAGTVFTSFGIATGNTLEGVLGAFLVVRYANGLQVFQRSRSVFRFIFLAAIVSTTVSATVGAATLIGSGLAAPSHFGSIWLTWWLGDASGVIVIAPLLLLGFLEADSHWDQRKILEAGAVALGLLFVSLVAFSDPANPTKYAFLSIPILLWVIFRFDKLAAALAVLLLSGFAILNLSQVAGTANVPLRDPLFLVQAFVAIVGGMSLALSAVVAERRQSEAKLLQAGGELADKYRRRETLLERAEKLTRTGSFEWDAASNRVLWSDQMYRIYGCKPDEFAGTLDAFLSYLHPDDKIQVRATVENAMRERQAYRMRERIMRPDGEIRVLDSFGEPLLDSAGAAIGLSGVCHDITEEYENDRRISESAARFRLVVESIKDYAIFMLDPHGDVISWNEGGVRINGYRAEEIVGQHLSRFYTAEDVQRGHPATLLAQAEGEGYVEDEGWRLRKDGSLFWANVIITALRDEQGKLQGFAKVTRDLTERRKSEVALSELSGRILRVQDQERQRIARELHDSTSPLLTGLIGKLYIIKRQLGADDKDILPALEQSLVLAEHAASVIRNTASQLHPTLLDQSGLLATLRWYVEAFNRRTRIHVDTQFSDSLVRLARPIETALFRMVEESLANVMRHSGSRSAQLVFKESAGNLTLEVTDKGQGMPAGTLAKLQAGSTVSGIGIWTMAERMKQVGGRLVIDSGDWGTTVKAIVPLTADR